MTERCGIADIVALPETALPVVRVVVASVEGSTPREAGAAMLVSRDGICGTIGGGQLEFEAISHARALLEAAEVEQAVIVSSTHSGEEARPDDFVPPLPLTHPPAGGSPLPQGERADRRHPPSSAPHRDGEAADSRQVSSLALSLDGEAATSRQSPPSALSLDGRGRREAPGEGGAARSSNSPIPESSRAQPAISPDGEAADARQSRSSALSLDGRGRREAPGEGGAARSGNLSLTETPLQPVHESGIRPATWLRDLRSWPLGPSLGQCCGGAVRVLFEHYSAGEHLALDAGIAAGGRAGLVLRPVISGAPPHVLSARQQARELPLHIARAASDMLSGARPRRPVLLAARKGIEAYFMEPVGMERKPLMIYGAGHVGRAIVRAIADLDFDVTWVDVHADRFPDAIPDDVWQIAVDDVPAIASCAPPGTYHLVLTYSHGLDFSICHILLMDPRFGFLGLIGSQTKRARFLKRLGALGIPPATLARLTCPIGIGTLRGKQPATIAISVAAQLIEQLENERGAKTVDGEAKRESSG